MKVYTLLNSIYNSDRNLIGYDVVDSTGMVYTLPVEQVIELARHGQIQDVIVKDKRYKMALEGINGNDLRKLHRRTFEKKDNYKMFCVSGKSAISYAVKATKDFANARELIRELNRYMNDTSSRKVCCIYGLRRTGKTVLMLQSLLSLHREDVAFINVSARDSISDVLEKVKQLVQNGIENIYIDEITNAVGFLDGAAILADGYAAAGVHIVISGTDSCMLDIASKSALYDRMFKINTSYISYKEYVSLFGNISILEYIRLGGVLLPNTFYDENSTYNYIQTAIVDNIIRSLNKTKGSRYQELKSLNDAGLLRKAIELAIRNTNSKLSAYMLTSTYKDGLGFAKEILGKHFHLKSDLDNEVVYQIVRKKLGVDIEHDGISTDILDELTDFLEEIGVLVSYKRYGRKVDKVYLFVQPGLRYRQTLVLVNSLFEAYTFRNMKAKEREMLYNKIVEDTEGQILEQVILVDNILRKKADVSQVRTNSGEIDTILKDSSGLHLYEIKRSNKVVDKQYRHLINNSLDGVQDRIVLYTGAPQRIIAIDGKVIQYQNIGQYLLK